MRNENLYESGLSRRSLLAMGSATLALGALRSAPALAQNPALPVRGDYLIKNAMVVSVDAALGTFANGDIHVANGAIVAVGNNLSAPGAEIIDASDMIAMPGFVDTHLHMWTTLARNYIADPARGYFVAKAASARHYTADDFYASERLGFAEAIHAGVTTIHNFSHNVRSPAHADAELRACADTGIRMLYTYGNPDSHPKTEMIDLEHIDALRRTIFAKGAGFDGLITLGINLRGPVVAGPDMFEKEMIEARKRKVIIGLHAGQGATRYLPMSMLRDKGWLDSSVIITHFLPAEAEDRKAMAETGASLSLSPYSEMRLGTAGGLHHQFLEMLAAGVNVTFSVDANSLGPINMFECMRLMYSLGIPWTGTTTEKLPAATLGQVIACATLNGAKACGLGTVTGSLTPGKRADLLLVRKNDINMAPDFEPESALVVSATPENIDTVFIDGRILKKNGKVVLDTAKIISDAKTASLAVRQRSGAVLAPSFR
jgi:5-methylthioadenosine/S-adenosylhomocysteine deaminase